jgi:hypothetical protein
LSKDISLVVDKEDDVSGQAVKPIYMKDQVNDGQTQRIGQTYASFTAVRAELQIVNDPVEDNPTSQVFASNTSPSAEINTCYNKFLQSHNLPIINNPITLGNFLSYL